MKKRQVKSFKKHKNSPPNSNLEKSHIDLMASIPQESPSNAYPNNLLNSILLNEPQEHKDVTLIEQCVIKTNESVALIWLYGPENK